MNYPEKRGDAQSRSFYFPADVSSFFFFIFWSNEFKFSDI